MVIKIILLILAFFVFSAKDSFAAMSFQQNLIDANHSGDVKIAGDVDGDGDLDLMIAGWEAYWYKNPTWQKVFVANANGEFTTDGKLGDVDGDGDLDLVVPDGMTMTWFANNNNGTSWTRNSIGQISDWGKDVHLSDFDNNGKLDIALRLSSAIYVYFQNSNGTWNRVTIADPGGGEGMGAGDVDGDGDMDLVGPGRWYENPRSATGNWQTHNIGGISYLDFKALVYDLDKNGSQDVLYSCSECGNSAEIVWFSTTNPKGGTWTKRTIGNLAYSHTLQASDFDRDGDEDVLSGQMVQSGPRQLVVFENGGNSQSWTMRVIGNPANGIHNGVIGDFDGDGDMDPAGSNWVGGDGVYVWTNNSSSAPAQLSWQYKQAANNHEQTFGLTSADVDSDGLPDIASGSYWYKHSGDVSGNWTRGGQFPNGIHVFASTDVDGDSQTDLIGQRNSGQEIYWLENSGSGFTSTLIGNLPAASHGIGFQGYKVAQLEAGGKSEIAVSSGNGIYYFKVPANPAAGNWPRIHVNANPSDEGLGVADIDNDGDIDIAAGTGDSKRVEWYRNPGNGSATWQAFVIGNMNEVAFPDRFEVADFNGDGKADIVGTEENGSFINAKTFWWQQPTNPTSTNWTRREIASIGSTNSMDIGDVDKDGDVDISLGEHRGDLKIGIWRNNGSGTFTQSSVDSGKESHLGARLFDLDNDADLDMVSIAYDASNLLHVWENNLMGGGGTTPPEPTPVATPEATAPPTNTTLAAYYPFTEGSGTSVADGSGNNHTGTIQGATWIQSGKFGSALEFDGSDRVELGNWSVPGSALTLAAWVKLDTATDDRRIISKASGGNEQDHDWMIGTVDGDGLRSRIKVNGSTHTLVADNVISTGVWTHVAVTFDGSNIILYKDGNPVAEENVGTSNGQLSTTSNQIYIGANPGVNYGFWDGVIDDAAIYSTTLNQTDIANLMTNGPDTQEESRPGDANGDAKINGIDYIIWLNHYNQSVSGPQNGDFNNSAKVDGLDYIIWLNNYGT